MSETIRSRHGRTLVVVGDPTLLTMDRLSEFTERIDSDPRIASLSLVPGPRGDDQWLRAAAPAGALVAVATDLVDLVGPFDPDDPQGLHDWARRASERGLWHDWWVTAGTDVVRAELVTSAAAIDAIETDDPSSAHHAAMRRYRPRASRLTVTVDVTWLGPYETGAQVLTTAALDALALQDEVTEIRLVGLAELPGYAQHLAQHPKVRLVGPDEAPPMSDVVWYPNQIDGRSNIASARRLGARVVTTYLDLIAYDIPRYHGSPEAWQAYRALQRRIALSVDGITTISADVATRLLAEVPRLEPARVLPLPLGLDHISREQAPTDTRRRPGRPGHRARRASVRRGAGQRLPAQEPRLRDPGVGGGPAGRAALRPRAGRAARQEQQQQEGRGRPRRPAPRPARAHPQRRTRVVGQPRLAPRAGHGGPVPDQRRGLRLRAVRGCGPRHADRVHRLRAAPRDLRARRPARHLVGRSARGRPRGPAARARASGTPGWTRSGRRSTGTRGPGSRTRLVAFFREVTSLPEVATSAVGADTAAADAAALSAILSSRTWRATAPLRRMSGRLRRG